jgi:hypothetical protein
MGTAKEILTKYHNEAKTTPVRIVSAGPGRWMVRNDLNDKIITKGRFINDSEIVSYLNSNDFELKNKSALKKEQVKNLKY